MSLYQNLLKQSNTATTVEMAASDNPGLDEGFTDPTLFCTAFKKNRFYLFSKRQPKDTSSGALFIREVNISAPRDRMDLAAIYLGWVDLHVEWPTYLGTPQILLNPPQSMTTRYTL